MSQALYSTWHGAQHSKTPADASLAAAVKMLHAPSRAKGGTH